MGRKTDDGYTREFELFWIVFPFRRGSKWRAFQCFTAAARRGVATDAIVEGARRFASVVELEQREPRFVPHATTWLAGRRWETIEDDEAAAIAALESTQCSKPTAGELTERAVANWLRSFDGGDECGAQPSLQFAGDSVVGKRVE